MGYKLLGFVVWKGGTWYVRRKFPHAQRNSAIGGGLALLTAVGVAALVAQRRSNGE